MDGCPAGKLVLVPLEDSQDFRFERRGFEGLVQRAPDLLGDGPLNTHALNVKVVVFVFLVGTRRIGEAMEMVVP
jgi:hypothetical protein